MTYPDPLEGLDADAWERLQLEETLGEIAAEEEAGLPYGSLGEPGPGDADPDDPGGDGPWDDQLGQLQAAGDQLDAYRSADAQRLIEDVTEQLDRRPSGEDKMIRALRRIEAGTYTQPEQLRPARHVTGRYASACGDPDDFGRCASRYHDPSCHVVTEEAAATGSYEEAEAWRDTLSGYTSPGGVDAESLGLATPTAPGPGSGTDTWAELLEAPAGPGSADAELRARLLAEMGEADAAPPPREPGRPDVSALRAALGL